MKKSLMHFRKAFIFVWSIKYSSWEGRLKIGCDLAPSFKLFGAFLVIFLLINKVFS